MRSVYSGFDGYRSVYLDDGSVNNENLGLRITTNNNSGDGMFGRLIRSREVLRNDFVIYRQSDGNRAIVIPSGDYEFSEGMLGIDFANQRKLTGRITTRWGEYYGGSRVQRNVELGYRPTPRFAFNGQFTVNEIHLPEGNFTVRLISLESQVAFSNTMSWRIFFNTTMYLKQWVSTVACTGFLKPANRHFWY